jgi:hypothetical protein
MPDRTDHTGNRAATHSRVPADAPPRGPDWRPATDRGSALSLIDRGLAHTMRTQSIAVDEDEMVAVLADILFRMSTRTTTGH